MSLYDDLMEATKKKMPQQSIYGVDMAIAFKLLCDEVEKLQQQPRSMKWDYSTGWGRCGRAPTNFRDAECCLTCAHSEVLFEIDSNFLKCNKFDTTCEDTTNCDEWQLKKDDELI